RTSSSAERSTASRSPHSTRPSDRLRSWSVAMCRKASASLTSFTKLAGRIRPLPEYVLDASALIALVNQEPGAEKVQPLMPHAVISAVNLCETIQRLRRGGMPLEAVTLALTPLVSTAVPFDESL